jgi:hypothetical protein
VKRGPQIAHNSGCPRVVERQQPRKSKRAVSEHEDRYAEQCTDPAERLMAEKLAALVTHFNGEEARHG